MNYLLILTDFKSTPTPPGQTFIAGEVPYHLPNHVPPRAPPFRDPGHPRIDNKYLMKQLVVCSIWMKNVTSVFCYISPAAIYDRHFDQHHQESSRWQMQEQNNSRRSAAFRPSWPASRVTRSTLSCGSAASWQSSLPSATWFPFSGKLNISPYDDYLTLIVQWFGDKTFQNSRQTVKFLFLRWIWSIVDGGLL